MSAAEDFAKAQAVEFGTYTATEVIYLDGVRAFNEGDPVPVGHVERKLVSTDQVKKVKASATTATSTEKV